LIRMGVYSVLNSATEQLRLDKEFLVSAKIKLLPVFFKWNLYEL
jgi:hypothetical protein